MPEKAAFAGSLSFLALADIFQILGGNASTGVLRITSQYAPNPGQIYFVDGNPINAANDPLQGIDAVYALFGWTEGKFEFREEEVRIKRVIKHSRMEITLDALRMLDDGVVKRVGPPSLDKESAAQKGGAEGEVVPLVKGPLVDYGYVIDEEEYRDGGRIVKEGGFGKWISVILDGSVNVTRETPKGPVTVARLGEGCFIGTFNALLFREYARTANVTAVGEVRLGVFDTERLYKEYESLPSDLKGLLLSLDGRLKKTTKRVVELYAKGKEAIELPKGKETIIKRGSSKEEVFAISEGEAYVIGQGPKGGFPLLTLGKEDVFGYVPSLDVGHEPRSASVLASEGLKVNKLNPETLQNEYDELSGTFRNFIHNVGTCVSVTTRVVYDLLKGKKLS